MPNGACRTTTVAPSTTGSRRRGASSSAPGPLRGGFMPRRWERGSNRHEEVMKPTGVRQLFRFISRSAQDVRADVDDELTFHVDMRTADLEATGMSQTEARARALREFGDVQRAARVLARRDEQADRLTGLGR